MECGTILTLKLECGTKPTSKVKCGTVTALNLDLEQYLL